MAINPKCGAPTVYDVLDERDQPTGKQDITCPCGWERRDLPSVSAAKRAHREHRFPGPNPKRQKAGARRG